MKKYFLIFALSVLPVCSAFSQNMELPQALKNYIEIARKDNPLIQAAGSRWKAADAKVSEAASNLYPKIDVSSRFTAYDGGRVINIPTIGAVNTAGLGITPWDTKIEALWPIGNYAVWQGLSSAEAFLDASTAQVDVTERDIDLQVSQAYFNYAKAYALIEVKKNQLKLAEENYKLSKTLFSADKVAKNDVLRAEVGVANAESDMITSRRILIVAQTAFNTLLNRKADANVEMINPEETAKINTFISDIIDDVSTKDAKMSLPNIQSDVAKALRERPEIKQLLSTETALEGVKRISAGDFFPSLAIFGSYGWQEESLSFSQNSDILVGGVQLKWNLFSGFGTKAKIDQYQAQIEETRFMRQAAQNGIQIELENARSEKISAIQRLSVGKKALASSEENYRITQLQYDNGTTTLINLLDAQITFGNARTNYTNAMYDLLIAEVKYKRALGIELN